MFNCSKNIVNYHFTTNSTLTYFTLIVQHILYCTEIDFILLSAYKIANAKCQTLCHLLKLNIICGRGQCCKVTG